MTLPSGGAVVQAREGRLSRGGMLRGFSLVELMVALVIAGGVIAVAAVALGSLSRGAGLRKAWGTVNIGLAAMENFYGLEQTSLEVPFAPNYGRGLPEGGTGRTIASAVRDAFEEDIRRASAVFCLARTGLNTYGRPAVITVGTEFDGRLQSTPQGFRAILGSDAQAIFSADRNLSETAPNATIFILQPSDTDDGSELWVRAVYDIDLTAATDPVGTYVSVKRYVNDQLTLYYDVFYPDETPTVFTPVTVAFERQARLSVAEGASVDRFKAAADRPFYFVWWPDPAMPRLGPVVTTSPGYAASDPRSAYWSMAGRTSFFLVVPMFPAL